MESQLTISPPPASARRIAAALFPTPVGPTMNTTVRLSLGKGDHQGDGERGRQEKEAQRLFAV
jgi:hypothetical protein